MKVIYKSRRFLDRFTCIDTVCTVNLIKSWENGGLLYGYKNRFEIVAIEKDMIVKIEK